uniref:Uncharacterized protein n=1 Tax=Meloidogyne enterolobii TaxID=390850 RepID=A0A6V7VFN6_MELEN|nr:unnamed protein product [Meloidogyne enterolobii]
MELLLFNHQEYERLYNCTNLVIDSIPIEKRRLTLLALINLILGLIYFLLYLPCLFSIWKQHWKNDCYTILLFIGIVDIVGLIITGFLHPILALLGAVFCSYPTLIFIAGGLAKFVWVAESTANLVLAFNRCLQVISNSISSFLFEGIKTYFWLLISFLYALFCFCFLRPVLFSGIYFSWFYYPFNTQLQFYHNLTVGITLPTIYLIFAVGLIIKNQKYKQIANTQVFSISHTEKLVFLQVFTISILNTTCSSLYFVMQFIKPEWLIIISQFAW